MGPRSKDTIPPPNSIAHNEMDDTDNQNDNNALTIEDGPETTDVADAWAVAEGYTPLNDLNNSGGDSYIMVSTGPTDSSDSDNDDEEGNARQGSFYVNPNMFGNMFGNTDGVDASQNVSSSVEDIDFDGIAASALSALDDEYQQTIVRPNPESSNEKEEDEDLKIIAAGFDERKEELKQIHEQGGFDVRWEDVKGKSYNVASKTDEEQQRKADNDVDTDAVRRAIETLSVKNKDAPFQQKFAAWQYNQHLKRQQENADPHTLIPVAPYKIFHETKPTAKSRQASADWSRSATLAEAVVRLSLLSAIQNDLLLIDIVGVDHVECESASTIQNTFRPFAQWLGDYFLASQGNRKIRVHFRLIGRELFSAIAAGKAVVDILESSSLSTSSSHLQATATCHSGVYHEFLEETCRASADKDVLEIKKIPDLAVAFNAGIWGYREWADTIQYLALQQYATTTIATGESKNNTNSARCGLPMIITAYTLDECQEDQEVISEAINSTEEGSKKTENTSDSYRAEILWASERNPFGSQVVRETKGSTQVYRENACWQAWLLGGKASSSSSSS